MYPWFKTNENKDGITADSLTQCFSAFGISNEGSKSPSRDVMRRRAAIYKKNGKNAIVPDIDEVHNARADFKSYQHLFFM